MANDIMILVSVAGILFLAALWLLRVRKLDKRTAKWQRDKEERRRKREEEVMRQVRGIKDRDDLASAKAAVARDPARAAKTVQKIMKD